MTTIRSSVRIAVLLGIALAISAVLVRAQQPPSNQAPTSTPRLADGHPDLNGLWYRRIPPVPPVERQGKTVVLKFGERDPNAELFWLIGADNVAGLEKWHRIDALRKLVQFVVLDRGCDQKSAHQFRVVQRNIDISATEIRKRVASGRSIRYLVPKAVEEIIFLEKLYLESGT